MTKKTETVNVAGLDLTPEAKRYLEAQINMVPMISKIFGGTVMTVGAVIAIVTLVGLVDLVFEQFTGRPTGYFVGGLAASLVFFGIGIGVFLFGKILGQFRFRAS